MDTSALVDGGKIIGELPQRGFEVAAAFWVQASEDERWQFCLVSPLVDTEGLARSYSRLHTAVRAMPQPLGIDPLRIKLIEPSDPVAQDVLAIRVPSSRTSPFPWSGKQLGDLSIEGAYIYPMPVAAKR